LILCIDQIIGVAMKKIYILFYLLIIGIPSLAKGIDELYLLKDVNYENALKATNEALTDLNLGEPLIVNGVVYSAQFPNYYIKTYPKDKNTYLYLVFNAENKQDIEKLLFSIPHKSYKIDDKDLKNRYKNDLLEFANNHKDVITIKSKSKKTKSYNPYIKPLNNRLLQRATIQEDGIEIVRNKYLSKSEVQDYANGYEYIITNKNIYPVVLKEVGSSDILSLQEIAKKCVKVEYSDFVPVYGLVRAIRTDIEKNKFTRKFPSNYTLNPNEPVKILMLAPLSKEPVVDFILLNNDRQQNLKFKTNKGENL